MSVERRSETAGGEASGARTVSILLIEDEQLFAKAVAKRLGKEGYHCEVAGTLAEGEARLRETARDLLLLDMRLPDGSGLEFLGRLRNQLGLTLPVLVMSAYGDLEDAVAAMKLQASDYLKKPVDLDELLVNVQKVLAKDELSRRLEYSRKRERHSAENVQLLGDCPQVQALRQQAERLGALCQSPDVIPPTVLILGETGTGKDMLARLLHASSARRERPFVHVDCASLPKDLIEAELFGHEKGAFTNAHTERVGLIEAAEDGLLFLDEIGELPLELQAKLLAVLERRTLRRVGSTRERQVPAWFVAATNRDMETMVKEGQLRSDLYYRLNVLTLKTPALRSRGEDVLLLAEHFARQTAARYGLPAPQFSPAARAAMRAYRWPGNVRELKHVMERAVLLSGGAVIEEGVLGLNPPVPPGSASQAMDLEGLTLEEAERLLIERALERTGWNVSETARQLGATRMAIRYRMKKHGFEGGHG